MCGGKATSTEQFGQSEIDLRSGSSASARNELKRPRPENSSPKPSPPSPKKRQVAVTPSPPPPPPLYKPACTTVTEAADVSTNSVSNSKAPPGVFDFPMPKPRNMFDMCQFCDVFFKSPIDRRNNNSKPILLEGCQPFDEILDPDMEHIWLPILRQPLILIAYKQKGFSF